MSAVDSMVEVYVYENNQLLEQLEEMLLASEKSTELSKAQVDEIFRVMHTIKGSSAMMGYDGLTKLSHCMEDVFSTLRQNLDTPKELWGPIFDLVLECIDFFKVEIEKVQQGLLPDGEFSGLHERAVELHKMVTDTLNGDAAPAGGDIVMPGDAKPAAPQAAAPQAAPAPVQQTAAPQANAPAKDGNGGGADMHYYKAKLFFEHGCAMESVRAFAVVRALDGTFNRIYHEPSDLNVNCDEAIINNGLLMIIETNLPAVEITERLEETMFMQSLEFYEVTDKSELPPIFGGTGQPAPVEEVKAEAAPAAAEVSQQASGAAQAKVSQAAQAEPAKSAAADQSAAAPKASATQNFLSVNVNKVDKLMDLVGEIVTTESMVTKNPEIEAMHLEAFEKQARRLRQLTDELQDVVMSIRMVPISSTFRKMQRIVRDMCKKTGKEAELILLGEQTEVDKNVIENLTDPLMHMIRNSMDHGLETTEERIAKGKPAGGTITLEARNTGGDVIILVADDGKGLDREKIIKKAQDKGLTSKTSAEISDREAYAFIMAPGFSTKEQVTEFSGRGVGMDVVRSNIEKMGGTVSIDSELGKGMTVTLHIPLTLAIIDGMDVQVGTEHFIIPILNIRESFEPKSYDLIIAPDGTESIMIRGKCYLVKRLHEMFQIPTEITDLKEGIMVLVESDVSSMCLFVDKLVGEQQAVIKPIPLFISRMVGRLPCISGCTTLANGSVSLILDINSITGTENN